MLTLKGFSVVVAAAIVGLISLKAASLSPPAADAGAAAIALFLVPYLGLAAAAGMVVGARKVGQYIQDNFYFKDYVQSRSGK